MCGIAGSFLKNPAALSLSEFEQALDTLNHRGPDASGVLMNQKNMPWS